MRLRSGTPGAKEVEAALRALENPELSHERDAELIAALTPVEQLSAHTAHMVVVQALEDDMLVRDAFETPDDAVFRHALGACSSMDRRVRTPSGARMRALVRFLEGHRRNAAWAGSLPDELILLHGTAQVSVPCVNVAENAVHGRVHVQVVRKGRRIERYGVVGYHDFCVRLTDIESRSAGGWEKSSDFDDPGVPWIPLPREPVSKPESNQLYGRGWKLRETSSVFTPAILLRESLDVALTSGMDEDLDLHRSDVLHGAMTHVVTVLGTSDDAYAERLLRAAAGHLSERFWDVLDLGDGRRPSSVRFDIATDPLGATAVIRE